MGTWKCIKAMCWSIKELLHNAYVLDNLIACVLVEEGGEIAKMSITKEVTVPNRGGTSRLPGTPQLHGPRVGSFPSMVR